MNQEQIDKLKNKIKPYIFPSYDELSVFILFFVFILSMFFSENFGSEFFYFIIYSVEETSTWQEGTLLFLLSLTAIVYLIVGAHISLFHVCVKREKGKITLHFLKICCLLVNGIVSIWSGIYIYKGGSGFLSIFPIWNIITGIISVYAIVAHEKVEFDQSDASPLQVFLGVSTALVLYYLFNFVAKFYWAITFSICMSYSFNLRKRFTEVPIHMKLRKF